MTFAPCWAAHSMPSATAKLEPEPCGPSTSTARIVARGAPPSPPAGSLSAMMPATWVRARRRRRTPACRRSVVVEVRAGDDTGDESDVVEVDAGVDDGDGRALPADERRVPRRCEVGPRRAEQTPLRRVVRVVRGGRVDRRVGDGHDPVRRDRQDGVRLLQLGELGVLVGRGGRREPGDLVGGAVLGRDDRDVVDRRLRARGRLRRGVAGRGRGGGGGGDGAVGWQPAATPTSAAMLTIAPPAGS